MDSQKLFLVLKRKIKHANIEIIGESVLKRPIYSVTFDFGEEKSVIIQGSIHAREHITCDLVVEMIFEISKNFEKYRKMKTPNLVFVPLSNPDGADLVLHGLESVENLKVRKFLRKINNNSLDFSLFKANANGVDLNNNFDARWGTGKANVFFPAPHGYVGKRAMSEPCTKALEYLVKKVKPIFTISYHTKGEEIYYDFFCKKEHEKRDKKIAKIVARTLNYKLVSSQNSSSGGFKDWCIEKFNIPSVTIEVGSDKLEHPIGVCHLEKIFKRNKKILEKLGKIAKECEMEENQMMKKALNLAKKAFEEDEVPVGAIIVKDGKIVSKAFNKREKSKDATAHAEILAIQKACKKLGDFRLLDCEMFVTLEPCLMCMGAILNSRIKTLYYGAKNNKENALSLDEIVARAELNHKTKIVGGILEKECSELVSSYFRSKRKIKDV